METGNFFYELDEMFKNGNLKAAERYLTDAMERVLRENDLPALLAVANELGGIFRVTGRLDEAKKIYAVALEMIALLGLENTEQHGTTLLNLASVHTESGEAEAALKLDEKAEMIFRRAGLEQDYRMAALYNNMSHALEKTGRQNEALDHAARSLAIIKNLKGHDSELATSYTTLGARYSKAERYEEAAKCLAEAEKLFRSMPGKPDVHYAAALNSLGELSFRAGKLQDAVGYFEGALQILKENYGENKSCREVAKNLEMAREAQRTGVQPAGSPDSAFAEASAISPGERLNGLALSEAYYGEYGRRMIEEGFSEYKRYMAIGLVGEGSECLGFDDELSEDHDFGPGFCIWLPDEIFQAVGRELSEAYEKLPGTYCGKRRTETAEGRGRVGVFSTGEFYRRYIGCGGIPETPVEWFFAPEAGYAAAAGGKVFEDHLGEFTRIRNGLLDFYPRDVLLKKLAARMAMMSQAGQYNYERCMKRKEYGAAYLSCGEFIKNAGSMVYLLNGRYMPFYKWMFRGMDQLKLLREVKPMLERLAVLPDLPEHAAEKVALIEDICVRTRDELRNQEIIQGGDAFLNSHCGYVMSQISDQRIRSLPVMFDSK